MNLPETVKVNTGSMKMRNTSLPPQVKLPTKTGIDIFSPGLGLFMIFIGMI